MNKALFVICLLMASTAFSQTCQLVERTGMVYTSTWVNPGGQEVHRTITEEQYLGLTGKGEPQRPPGVEGRWAQATGTPVYNTPGGDMDVGDFEVTSTDIHLMVPSGLFYILPLETYQVVEGVSGDSITPDPPGLSCTDGVLTITDETVLPQ